ncbi:MULTISPECIES: hypothetical protein [unclassified Haloarcula]|uniref:hypothetical protein n=1 Tax=unclassified Haloarcula TaxID=2624677 RepID=UPI0006786B23|nr:MULTISPECIES: hypothetical protein [unclassified Haloarcula]
MTNKPFTAARSLFLVVLLVVSAVAGTGTVAAQQSGTPVADTTTSGEVTIQSYNVSWDPIQYENNNGELVAHPSHVNESVDNPYSFVATDIEVADYGVFPRKSAESDNSASALDASEWSTTVSDTTNTALSASDVETAPGVDAVNIATGGSMGAGDTATATYSNFSVTSDEKKRYLQVAMDVNQLDTAATVDVRVVDENGDYYVAEVNASRSSGEDLIGSAQGEGYVFQRQLGDMELVAAGDGTFDNIEKTEIVIADADADVSVAAVNVQKMSTWDLGTQLEDTDGDSELEESDILEISSPGAVSITSLDSMGQTFQKGTIHDLTIDFASNRSDRDADEIVTEFNQTNQRPGYYGTATIYMPTGLPSAYELSYADVKTTQTQAFLADRYIEVSYAEGVGDTAPKNISSWTDITSSFSSQGANVTVDDTLQPGQTNYVVLNLQLQENEFKNTKNAFATAGAAVMGPGGSGGGLGSIPLVGGALATLGSLWAYVKGLVPFIGPSRGA